MRYHQAKLLIDKLMDIAVLFHGSPSMLRDKLYAAIDEFLPNLDEACMERGCPAFDARDVAEPAEPEADRYEHETCSMACYYVDEGMYSIEELEELVAELKAVKKMQDDAINRTVKPVEEPNDENN